MKAFLRVLPVISGCVCERERERNNHLVNQNIDIVFVFASLLKLNKINEREREREILRQAVERRSLIAYDLFILPSRSSSNVYGGTLVP